MYLTAADKVIRDSFPTTINDDDDDDDHDDDDDDGDGDGNVRSRSKITSRK